LFTFDVTAIVRQMNYPATRSLGAARARERHHRGSGDRLRYQWLRQALSHPQTACVAARKSVNPRGNTPAFTVP
jgi:hypothetical protein